VKAYAYIDGLNLYNGALKGRPKRKWLDVRKVCEELLPSKYQLSWIRYFTARVPGSATDPHQPQRQDLYLRALRGECTPFSLHEERFRTDVSALPRAGSPSAELVKVRVTQEKGSDVNLAVHLIDDAAEIAIDHEGREVHRPPAWIVEAENGEAAPRGGLLPSSRSS
jgi:hypothetical protein